MLLGKVRRWLGKAGPPAIRETSRRSARRIAAERVWGTGFHVPGGGDEIARLIAPMRLALGQSFLLVSDGGAAVQDVIAATGAIVIPFTTDPVTTDPARPAGMQIWDRASPDFGQARYARALAIEPLGGAAPEKILVALAAAIMPVGQLTLVELVADKTFDAGDATAQSWLAGRDGATPPPGAGQISRAFGRLGFALQTVQDLSQHHVHQARQGWNMAMARLAAAALTDADRAALEAEGEFWRARLHLLAAGHLRLICWHAVGKAPLV